MKLVGGVLEGVSGARLRRWRLLFEALSVVVVVRLALTLRITDLLRSRIARFPAGDLPSIARQREVAWSVTATSRLVPKATCLTQALAGQYLLARHGGCSVIRVTFPAFTTGSGFKPHAWLFAGPTILLGGSGQDFASHRLISEFQADGSGRAPREGL